MTVQDPTLAALLFQEKGLNSLEPIRKYPHLVFVDVSKNQLVDTAPLSDLRSLVSINLAGNALAMAPTLPNPHLMVCVIYALWRHALP